MSRTGDEMIRELATLLDSNIVKSAAKKDDDEKEDKKKEKDEKKEDKKKEKEDKNASMIMGVLQDLVKLAGELDDAGAEEASKLVDDALATIVSNIEKKKIAQPTEEYPEEEDITESFEEEPVVDETNTWPELEGATEPEGLTPDDIGIGTEITADSLDKLSPEEQTVLKDLLGKLT